jgi:probable HAF family extracellular repeat protein
LKRLSFILFLTIIAVCSLLTFQAIAVPIYSITDLGTLGGSNSFAYAINNTGQIVGQSDTPSGNYHAFIYDSINGMQDLGTLGGNESIAHGINDNGQVVGESDTGIGSAEHAFLYDSTNGMQDLGTIGSIWSEAYGINDNGHIVGVSSINPNLTGHNHAFLYRDNQMTDLGTLGGISSWAYGINNANQVTGLSHDGNMFRAFLYDNGVMSDIGSLGYDTGAYDINDAGQIVGWSYISTPADYHAFLYDSIKGMKDLGTLGGTWSNAYGINNAGQVVGVSSIEDVNHAFLYTNGTMFDLNSLIPSDSGWVLKEAWDINGTGQIVGFGDINGKRRAFLMTPAQVEPIPEPTTIWLMSCGLLGLLGIVIRQRRKDTRSR